MTGGAVVRRSENANSTPGTRWSVRDLLKAGVEAAKVGKKVYDTYEKRKAKRTLPGTKGGTERVKVGKRKPSRFEVKRKRRVVDKKFAAKVKTVIQNVNKGVVNTSTFRKYWDMVIKPKGSTFHTSGPLKTFHTGCDWFGGDKSGTLPTFVRQFTPFNTLELLDAVSVMYNGKANSSNYTTVTNNFDTKDLKVHFPYMSCTITFVNCTQLDGTLDVYECIAKTDSNQDLSSVVNSHKTSTQLAVVPHVEYSDTKLKISRFAKLADFPINATYSIKKTSHKLNRNAKVSIFAMEKDVYVDFENRLTEAGVFANYAKGHKQYVVEFRPNIGFITSGERSIGNAVRYYPDGLTDAETKGYGIAVAYDRTFTVDQPAVCDDLYEGSRVNVQDIRTTMYEETNPTWWVPDTQMPNIDYKITPAG